MTSNVNNQGIFHLAYRSGGDPFCKARRAHMTCTPANAEAHNYAVCKRCAAKLEKMRAADRKARPVAVVDEESTGDRIRVVERFITVKAAEEFIATLPDQAKVERGGLRHRRAGGNDPGKVKAAA